MPESLPGRVLPPSSVEDRIEKLTGELTLAATHAIQTRGVFHLALPADVPHALDLWYTALVIDPRWRGVPWQKTHLWQSAGHKPGDNTSWQMLTEALLAHLPLEPDQLHSLPNDSSDPLDGFAADMERVFGDQNPCMDMAITTEATLAMPVVSIDSWQLAAARNVLIWLEAEPSSDLLKAAGYFDGELFWVRSDQIQDDTPRSIDLV